MNMIIGLHKGLNFLVFAGELISPSPIDTADALFNLPVLFSAPPSTSVLESQLSVLDMLNLADCLRLLSLMADDPRDSAGLRNAYYAWA
jgi:hypothetical protein